MRTRLLLAVAIGLLLVAPAAAQAQVQAPGLPSGGAGYGRIAPLVPRAFSVAPGAVRAGTPVTVRLRLTGDRGRRVRARIALTRVGARRAAGGIDLGVVRTGRTVTRSWRPLVRPGRYVARLRIAGLSPGARTSLPLTVTRRPTVPPPAAVPTAAGRFPVRGEWSFGGADARFGAGRPGHVHQGQDITAAEGTPVVSPVAGSVYWRAVQPGGAGHYLVVRGADGTDYVFMHLVAGSETVGKGDAVGEGQVIGQVGTTGRSSGPHLHFEMWPDGWYAEGSKPIDPLPTLRGWASA